MGSRKRSVQEKAVRDGLSVCSGAKLNCREIQKGGCKIEKQSCEREMEKSI